MIVVCPMGGGSKLSQGLPTTCPGVLVDMRALSQVIDYPARDMTITVQAGITFAKLNEILATENQRLPIDVPFPERATLGGAIATNTSGPRRYGFGTFRDYVIGITTINDEGQETKAGGRVVKNVAGYDMCKLHIGACGTLGIISQVTLKVKPRPEQQAFVVAGCHDNELARMLDAVHESRTQPVCVDVLNSALSQRLGEKIGLNLPTSAWVLLLGFEHNREAVDWQVDQIRRELAALSIGTLLIVKGIEADPIWQALTEASFDPSASLLFKANLLPSGTADFCSYLNSLSFKPGLHAHAGNGIVIGQLNSIPYLESAKDFIQEALTKTQTHQGNLVVLKCPVAWSKALPIWGAPRGDNWLMRAVKNKLDPKGLFNPGRFVDGN
ncbi:MAG TPA: FAD-binding oxidoreductase, partial [Gemmataceae bacterium]|nr:FAD-binding oxidoreductase [Gemmataceae bacterium]